MGSVLRRIEVGVVPSQIPQFPAGFAAPRNVPFRARDVTLPAISSTHCLPKKWSRLQDSNL